MTDCIPADAVREFVDRLRSGAFTEAEEGLVSAIVPALDSLIAQARPCDSVSQAQVEELLERCQTIEAARRAAHALFVIAPARPCDEGLREALEAVLRRYSRSDGGPVFIPRREFEDILARTALAEEGK